MCVKREHCELVQDAEPHDRQGILKIIWCKALLGGREELMMSDVVGSFYTV